MRKTLSIIAFAVVAVFFASCEKEVISQSDAGTKAKPKPGAPVDSVKFAANIMPIFTNDCAGCHGAGSTPDFSANADAIYTELTTGTTFINATPKLSHLYVYINDATTTHSGGVFAQDAIKILTWIQQGHKKN